MFVTHVGPQISDGGLAAVIGLAAAGRSSILFAVLSGISLGIMTSSVQEPGIAQKRYGVRLATRALILVLIGTVLSALGTPVQIILGYYGVWFVLCIPFLKVTARTLLIFAATLSILGPIAQIFLLHVLLPTGIVGMVNSIDPLWRLSGEGLTSFFLTGTYPLLSWFPYVLTGLAVSRFGITAISKRTMLIIGSSCAVFGYGTFWALSSLFADIPHKGSSDWLLLLSAEEHTGMPLEIFGGIGVALIIVTFCLWLCERYPRASWPLAAMGTVSLTAYTGHVIAIKMLDLDPFESQPFWLVLAFIGSAVGFALLWLRYARRGPLEMLVHLVSTKAQGFFK